MAPAPRLAVIGAGGHAKVVIDAAEAVGWRVIGVADDRPNHTVFDLPYLGSPGSLRLEPDVSAVIAIGVNTTRQHIAQQLEQQLTWATIIHPQAVISARAQLGVGTVVLAGAVIQADTVIGNHVVINTGARIDHDNQIGDYCHIAPGAVLTGTVSLEKGVFVGAGAIMLPGVRAGSWSTLGAGGVARRDLEPHQIYAGVPARIIRQHQKEQP